MARDRGRDIDYLLILLIALLGAAVLYSLVAAFGPPWDLMARYLNGKTLFDFVRYGIAPQVAFAGEFFNNQLFYFEPYREPLSMPIFAFMDIFFSGSSVIPYLMAVYIGLLFAVYKLGKEMGIDRLILFSALINSYALYFMFFINGGEALALIFVLLALVYMMRRSPISGLMLGIASIAKYPTMILLPLVLLLNDREKVTFAVVLELVPLLLWGAFDYFIYGVPFYSYIASLNTSNVLGSASAVSIGSVAEVIAYPLIFVMTGMGMLYEARQKIRIKWDYTTKILVSAAVLSAIGYVLVLPHNDPTTQARYGFLVFATLAIPAGMLLSKISGKFMWLRYAAASLSIIALLCCIYLISSQASTPTAMYYNPLLSNTVYSHAAAALSSLGFGNCRFVSNAWVPMVYDGYDAYSPFILYTNNAISPFIANLTASEGAAMGDYQSGQDKYPIIAFKYIGVQKSFILNINQSREAYTDGNFTVYLPMNASCYVG